MNTRTILIEEARDLWNAARRFRPFVASTVTLGASAGGAWLNTCRSDGAAFDASVSVSGPHATDDCAALGVRIPLDVVWRFAAEFKSSPLRVVLGDDTGATLVAEGVEHYVEQAEVVEAPPAPLWVGDAGSPCCPRRFVDAVKFVAPFAGDSHRLNAFAFETGDLVATNAHAFAQFRLFDDQGAAFAVDADALELAGHLATPGRGSVRVRECDDYVEVGQHGVFHVKALKTSSWVFGFRDHVLAGRVTHSVEQLDARDLNAAIRIGERMNKSEKVLSLGFSVGGECVFRMGGTSATVSGDHICGVDTTIGFSPSLLKTALKALGSDTVKVDISDAENVQLFAGSEDGAIVGVMPHTL